MYKSTVIVMYSEVVLHRLPCKPEERSMRRLVHLPHTSTQSEFCLSQKNRNPNLYKCCFDIYKKISVSVNREN